MKTVIKVLGRKTSGNVQKVLWMLEELGTQYEREDYGRQFNNTTDEKYLSLNPNAKVPTLVDGSVTIWESNSILRYLARSNGNRFYATDAATQSRIERWMDWQLSTLDGAFLAIFREMKNEQKSAQFAANVAALGTALGIMDKGLNGAAWIAGNDMTVADFCLGPMVGRCLAFGVALPELKDLRRWHEAVAKRPAFQKATAA
jgi:glutathione S-transferase